MINFTIWVDADSCPILVRNIISRFSSRLSIPLKYVANHEIPIKKNKLTQMIISENSPDSADNYIVDHININDIVITRDIPLAERLVEKNVTVINDRGTEFTKENIGEYRSIRDFNFQLAQFGITADKSGSYGQKEINKFSNLLDNILQRKIKS
ncbi:MAG: DUF188 domain-containing protein [Treponema sp.]|nr:DUF188 domain-containing protein [Treponema sp.]